MISFAITVCNEQKELDRLLSYLAFNVTNDDEIIIQMDELNVTNGVKESLNYWTKTFPRLKTITFPLNKDFASFKNNLTANCSKKWIFNIDADEMPSATLVENLHDILTENDSTDVILIPRKNIVNNITDDHIKKWGWNLNENGWINWPDYQMRLFKNRPDISWIGQVHERLFGYKSYSYLPAEEEYCLDHIKEIEKQEKQNQFYSTIDLI